MYRQITNELVRYIKLRIPPEFKDEFNLIFLPHDDFEIGKFIVRMYPRVNDKFGYPGVEIIFYEKLSSPAENTIINFADHRMMKCVGWVDILLDGNYKNIVDTMCECTKVSKYITTISLQNKQIGVYNSKYGQCGNKVKIPLCIDEIFYENGGRKKDLINFHNQLTLLNIGLM